VLEQVLGWPVGPTFGVAASGLAEVGAGEGLEEAERSKWLEGGE